MENSFFYPYKSVDGEVAVKIVWTRELQMVTAKLYVKTDEFDGLLCTFVVNVPSPKIRGRLFNMLARLIWRLTDKDIETIDLKSSFLLLRVFPIFRMSVYFRPSDRCLYVETKSWLDFNIKVMIEKEHVHCLCSDVHGKASSLVQEYQDGLYYQPVIIHRKGHLTKKKDLVYIDLKKLNSKSTHI